MEEPTPPASGVPATCRCWMLRPVGFLYREVCAAFVPHEFLRVGDHAMCRSCAHLRTCHLDLVLLPLDLEP